jgi:hypothetical protein
MMTPAPDEILEAMRYPIGRFQWDGRYTLSDREEWIKAIAGTPDGVRAAVAGLTAEQLDTRYREGGWSVRQVVHHYADDHMNGYFRFKLALTEDAPLIRAWSEPGWAELPDALSGPIEPSLDLLTALHKRWVGAWKSLDDSQWERVFIHPIRGEMSLNQLGSLYAWHAHHHVAHIRNLRIRRGW